MITEKIFIRQLQGLNRVHESALESDSFLEQEWYFYFEYFFTPAKE